MWDSHGCNRSVLGFSFPFASLCRRSGAQVRTRGPENTGRGCAHWHRRLVSGLDLPSLRQPFCSSSSASRRDAHVVSRLLPHGRVSDPGRSACCRDLDGCVRGGTTQRHNTHIRDLGKICYPWHPWHGRAVCVQAALVKRGQAVAYCSLEDLQTSRVLEMPLWMLDVAACCKTRVSKQG